MWLVVVMFFWECVGVKFVVFVMLESMVVVDSFIVGVLKFWRLEIIMKG